MGFGSCEQACFACKSVADDLQPKIEAWNPLISGTLTPQGRTVGVEGKALSLSDLSHVWARMAGRMVTPNLWEDFSPKPTISLILFVPNKNIKYLVYEYFMLTGCSGEKLSTGERDGEKQGGQGRPLCKSVMTQRRYLCLRSLVTPGDRRRLYLLTFLKSVCVLHFLARFLGPSSWLWCLAFPFTISHPPSAPSAQVHMASGGHRPKPQTQRTSLNFRSSDVPREDA